VGETNHRYGKTNPDLARRNKETCPTRNTKWFNNGQVNKRFHPGSEPKDFVQGRLVAPRIS
jgi:hypothetical protein